MNEQDEYKMLRHEIAENMKSQQQISVTAVSLTVSVLTIVGSFASDNPYLFLIPLLLLLPSAIKTRDLKDGIMTLSGYLIARYENSSDIPFWETTLNKYRKKYAKTRSKALLALECSEFAIAGLICELLYISAAFSRIQNMEIIPTAVCIISALVIIFLFYITYNYPNMDFYNIEEKEKRWESILEEHNKQ